MQGSNVRGLISCTCDAWQASNVDGYFAITGHWVEKNDEGILILQNSLIGFVCLNRGHSGKQLGQTLFKVFDRVGAVHKIGWVTCDNASNNSTMMEELAHRIEKWTGQKFCPVERRIRYLHFILMSWCSATYY
jgi:hypothetical protein